MFSGLTTLAHKHRLKKGPQNAGLFDVNVSRCSVTKGAPSGIDANTC